ncbi:MAG: sulfatase [Planctomycetota bacterium]
MGSLLLPLPVLAVILAALDTALVRLGLSWRAPDVRLFFHAYFLWALFGLFALAPAWLTLRVLERVTRPWPAALAAARAWLVLLAWMVLPVVAESVLDRATSLVGFGGLAAPGVWAEFGGVVLAALALLLLVGRVLGGLPGVRTAVVGVGLAFALGLFLPARAPRAAATSASPRPNLLLLVLDTCRADKLEPYGHARPTSPGLAALAEESILFEDSLSASTFTFTSHLSMLSGVLPETHGAHLLDMRFDPARAQSLAQLLRAAGYRTGAFVGTDVLAGRTNLRAGFDVYDDQVDPPVCDTFAWRLVHALQSLAAELVPALRFNGRPHWIQDFQRPGDEVLARTLAFIRRDDPRPWFAFVNLYDVHWPYVPEGAGREELVRPYAGPVDGFLFRSDAWQPGYRLDEHDKRHVNDLYEGEIHDLDALVARFLDELDLERGGTAVLVTADHGEGMGEGDTWNHDDVREVQVRVPMILRLPQPTPRGERRACAVSGIDVAPTLLELAGLAVPPDMEGRSLLAPSAAGRERWVDDRDHIDVADFRCALYRDGFKLVRFGRPPAVRYELYDLSNDPGGFRDAQSEHPELFQELVARMQARGGGTTRGGDTSATADALEALGYAGDE